ncbi:hypothetical protein PR048_029409 [Dryococelus australis]|uniref:Uncharacterized protein n=1 Tax=Dryococelus australis TaxID=614101 RepID=A0ABQ9GFU1_9NEOP|nr:hypothetical protein PR048_029409 [Dryococelus australis]
MRTVGDSGTSRENHHTTEMSIAPSYMRKIPPPHTVRKSSASRGLGSNRGRDTFHHRDEGATVAERLACSPPTKAIRVQSPAGFSHAVIVPDDAVCQRVFSGISRLPALSFRPCSILTSITLIGSQDLDVTSCPNLFTLHRDEMRPRATLPPRRAADGDASTPLSGRHVRALRSGELLPSTRHFTDPHARVRYSLQTVRKRSSSVTCDYAQRGGGGGPPREHVLFEKSQPARRAQGSLAFACLKQTSLTSRPLLQVHFPEETGADSVLEFGGGGVEGPGFDSWSGRPHSGFRCFPYNSSPFVITPLSKIYKTLP